MIAAEHIFRYFALELNSLQTRLTKERFSNTNFTFKRSSAQRTMCDTLAALSPTLMDPGDHTSCQLLRGRSFNVNRTASPLPSPAISLAHFGHIATAPAACPCSAYSNTSFAFLAPVAVYVPAFRLYAHLYNHQSRLSVPAVLLAVLFSPRG